MFKSGLYLLILLFATPSFAARDGQYCLDNKLLRVVGAVLHNVSVGVKIYNGKGEPVLTAPEGGPLHFNWTAATSCYPAEKNGQLELFYRDSEGEWAKMRTYRTDWLDGIDVIFHKEKKWVAGEGYGINLKFTRDAEQDINPERWMTELFARQSDLHFRDLCLIGSHITGSYGQGKKSLFIPKGAPAGFIPFQQWVKKQKTFFERPKTYVLRQWAQTQDLTVEEQLQAGVRFLDMQLTPTFSPYAEDDYLSTFGMSGARLSAMLADINAFLNTNPDELLVLRVNLVTPKALYFSDLYELLENTLQKERLISPDQGVDFSIAEILETQARIIVIADSLGEAPAWLWNSKDNLEILAGKAPTPLNETRLRRLDITGNLPDQPGKLNLAPVYLEPAPEDYSTLPHKVNSRYALNRTLLHTSGLTRYVANALRSQGLPLNLVNLEFAGESDVLDVCLAEMKRPRLPGKPKAKPQPPPVEPEVTPEPAPEPAPEPESSLQPNPTEEPVAEPLEEPVSESREPGQENPEPEQSESQPEENAPASTDADEPQSPDVPEEDNLTDTDSDNDI
ncbi:hypothetical protein [Parendozoicomonas haliclonae]|uniref:Uncharacterized protein n=1 Tax=Parendozoicomonas haliclonae TaxID=1960125 RepID=A0A1X7AI40_9GAMM|nr:hypothetical protein [Parendozoicomonas haliclonae]SMA43156.1 hypothetical protein EHSB41UT_01564 [Parendozoicomonas haliclonae]